eukprot:GHRR01028303.1.p2 GENE.GHRR01028303.1~~GHRR01028303.1.p2  ORF type:complete len:101 (-),score=18.96 GHRR01028303.1:299-601(-)
MLVLEKCKTLRQLQQQLYCEPILLWALNTSSKKPAISQKVKFVDQLKVVTRGGKGGGGASALFGRTGVKPSMLLFYNSTSGTVLSNAHAWVAVRSPYFIV